MPTEGHMTKFLYSILKQLDLKPVSILSTSLRTFSVLIWGQIDWSLVATELEISNGHAARMRYSRFKQQMEGTVSVSRTAKPKKTATKGDTVKGDSGKGAKLGKGGGALDKEKRFGSSTTLSSGKGGNASMEAPPAYSRKRRASEEGVKNEATDSNTRGQQMTESPMLSTSSLPHAMSTNNRMAPNGMMTPFPNANSSNSTSFPSTAPYPLPLRSPTQLAMNADNMMSHQPSYFGTTANPHHHHYHYHPYGNTNPDYTTDPFARPQQSWHHPEYCFSGCCQPPPYPTTPNMYPSYPATTTVSTPSTSALFPSQQQQQNIHPQLLQQSQNVWVPIKQGDGEEGVSDELLVKIEIGGESEMRVD
jgi:hypothetical protein